MENFIYSGARVLIKPLGEYGIVRYLSSMNTWWVERENDKGFGNFWYEDQLEIAEEDL